jgi:hypothetical protein
MYGSLIGTVSVSGVIQPESVVDFVVVDEFGSIK